MQPQAVGLTVGFLCAQSSHPCSRHWGRLFTAFTLSGSLQRRLCGSDGAGVRDSRRWREDCESQPFPGRMRPCAACCQGTAAFVLSGVAVGLGCM